jgi:hypothetical protein
MFPELAAILLGACAGAIAAVYAADAGYLGHRKMKAAAAPVPSIDTYVTTTEQAPEVPATEAPAVAEPAPSPEPEPAPAPSPAPALYETVQPAPMPVTYTVPTTSFGAPTLAKKPTRTYRRRTAPIRSAAGSKKTLPKSKKR